MNTPPTLRPIRPDDAERLERLFYRLSPRTVYLRFLSPLRRPDPARIRRLVNVDGVDRQAIVAEAGGEVVGVARYDRVAPGERAEVAVLVEDAWQGRGVGRSLMAALTEAALANGVTAFTATMLAENRRALQMARSGGATAFGRDGAEVSAVMMLDGGRAA